MASPEPEVVVVFNPEAGRLRRGRHARLLASARERFGPRAASCGTASPELPALLRALDARRGVVLAAGGDGTINTVASALAAARGENAPWPRVAVLPVGSANDGARALAEHLGRPLPPGDAGAAFAAVEAALAGDGARPGDLGRVSWLGAVRYFVNFAALGSPADWARLAEADALAPLKALSPRLAYQVCNLAVIARNRRFELEVTLDGAAARRETVFGWFAANARYLGGSIDLGPSASPASGTLAIVAVPSQSRIGLVRLLTAARHGHGPTPALAATARVVLRGTGRRWLNLDGEVFPLPADAGAPLDLSVLRGRIRWV
jgi:diacylglycerol kinase family enzyme